MHMRGHSEFIISSFLRFSGVFTPLSILKESAESRLKTSRFAMSYVNNFTIPLNFLSRDVGATYYNDPNLL